MFRGVLAGGLGEPSGSLGLFGIFSGWFRGFRFRMSATSSKLFAGISLHCPVLLRIWLGGPGVGSLASISKFDPLFF